SSPTSARAIAARISSVGRVTVSLRRSIMIQLLVVILGRETPARGSRHSLGWGLAADAEPPVLPLELRLTQRGEVLLHLRGLGVVIPAGGHVPLERLPVLRVEDLEDVDEGVAPGLAFVDGAIVLLCGKLVRSAGRRGSGAGIGVRRGGAVLRAAVARLGVA